MKPLVLYGVEHGIAVEPMKGKWASCQVDLGYTELFCITEVTAVFLSSCDSLPGDALLLRRQPGVHSRVTAGVDINSFCFFSDVRSPL